MNSADARFTASAVKPVTDADYRMMVDAVNDYAIFMLDPAGRIRSWNAGAQRLNGYTAEEAIGRSFELFYTQEDIDAGRPRQELEETLRIGRIEDEGWRLRKDGSRFWASVVITTLHDETGRHRGFAKVTRDLTTQRRIDVLEGESRQLTQFLAILGHELRNPLASISNAVAIMQMEAVTSPRLMIVRDVLSRQVTHFKRLVDDLLDVGRIASGKVHLEHAPVGLQQVMAEALESIAPSLRERRQQLETQIEDIPLWVVGDKVRLVQVLTNLLHNACKFTPEAGRVRISLARVGNQAELSVADNGRGIAPHELNDVFKLFAQGEQGNTPAHGGLGIGLNVVYQMVQRHGGEVSVFSTGVPGEGAEFVVRLPLMGATPDATFGN